MKILIILTLFFTISLTATTDSFGSKDKVAELWVNKSFSDCVQKSKSIYNCIDAIQNLLVFWVDKTDSTIRVTASSDLHDSGIYELTEFSETNNVFWAETRDTKGRFEIISEDSIVYQGALFIRIFDKEEDVKFIYDYFGKHILDGQYVDLNTNDTIIFETPKMFRIGKPELTFQIGIDFLEISIDYFDFNFSKNEPFEKRAYCYFFRGDTLEIKDLIYKNEEYISGDNTIYLLKRNSP